jgi:hypothetical protein
MKTKTAKIMKMGLNMITAVIFFASPIQVYASFEDLGMGGRATGMGNAFTAVADDAYAIYYNPAGLNNIKYPEFASTYGKMLMGLDDKSNLGNSFLAYTHPLEGDVFNDFFGSKKIGTLGIAWQEFKLNRLYKENALYISYAHMIAEKFGFGINIKNLRREFGSDQYTENAIDQNGNALGSKDPLFNNGKSKSAMGIDMGAQASLGRNDDYAFGLALININQPDLALGDSADRLPLTIKFGFQYKNPIVNFSMDYVRKKSLQTITDNVFSAGVEKWMETASIGNFGLRSGFGLGTRNFRSLSCGASYRIHAIQFDYGFVMPLAGIENTMGSHRVSMSFRFGDMDPTDDIGSLLMDEEQLYLGAKEMLDQARRELAVSKKEAELAQQEVELLQKQAHMDKSADALLRAQKAEHKAQTMYERAFSIAIKFYKNRITKDTGLNERAVILRKIIAKYKSTGVAIYELEKELVDLKTQLKTLENEYISDMNYFKSQKNGPASTEDKQTVLNQIIDKYQPQGIDVSHALKERENLGVK